MALFFGWLVIGVGSPVLNGWTLTLLWRWFVVPVFPVPPLTISAAIGISLVMAYLTHQCEDLRIKDERDPETKFGHALAWALAKPGCALLIGWIVVAVAR